MPPLVVALVEENVRGFCKKENMSYTGMQVEPIGVLNVIISDDDFSVGK